MASPRTRGLVAASSSVVGCPPEAGAFLPAGGGHVREESDEGMWERSPRRSGMTQAGSGDTTLPTALGLAQLQSTCG